MKDEHAAAAAMREARELAERQRLEADGWTFVPGNDVMADHYEKNGSAWIPNLLDWTQLAEDAEPPTQYHFQFLAGRLLATSKDHAYILDESKNVWIKVSDKRIYEGEK